ncbi:peptidase M10A and M12B matrixin and adamalysin [Natronosalvus vescus]|uniref:peptidase M10A and M12B matrixin and adamalysin n=1 Tax=Natronosalvus vescus TaxID=2953881 RepID=UPI002091543F|nr:peptidase M10A and M12B matrixin and adamalysin [Natronosalvus vescus]
MKRRAFIAGVGSVGTLGGIRYATRDPVTELEVGFWMSEGAAQYDTVVDRVTEYLELALGLDFWTVTITYGGTIPVESEDGVRPVRRGRWPAQVAMGAMGPGSLESAVDANVLVTDGQMRQAPTGIAIPHVASVGGARYIDQLDPPSETPDPDAYSLPSLSIQVLIHEIGHTLGLRHGHGTVYQTDEGTVATPMVSAYAWDSSFETTESLCGDSYETQPVSPRLLTYQFSSCARERLAEYSGGVRP